MDNLKLYVWEEVFVDYTYGLAFAIAESKEEAMRLALIDFSDHWKPYGLKELSKVEPKILPLSEKIGFSVEGGM